MQLSFTRLLLAAALVVAGATANPSVTFPTGATVTGLTETNVAGKPVNAFRGIRYTDAPIGDKRWKQSKLKPLAGAVDATSFGSACLGDARYDPTYGQFPVSEDCLFVNVFAPAGASPSSKLPVKVWIHGGGFIGGSSSPYNGGNLIAAADEKLVVVSFNYRLGVFGFLSNDEVLKQGDGANFGFRDQQIAFQWVQKYIQQFGGNPYDITAFGESAGAMSIAMHMISGEGSQQLFSKGIMQSGAHLSTIDVRTVAQQNAFTGGVAASTGCGGAQGSVLDCLRGVNATAVHGAAGPFPWGPTVDGVFLKDLPYKRVQANKISLVPTIIGTNTDEGWLFTTQFADAAAFDTFLRVFYPLLTESEYAQVAAMYPADRFATPQLRVAEIFGDVTFVCPSEAFSVQLASRASIPTYRYRFNQTAPVAGPLALHTAEIDYVFNNVAALPQDDRTKSLVAAMQSYWVNFAKTGNPNGNAVSQSAPGFLWPEFEAFGQEQIVLQTDLGVERSGAYMPDHDKRCAFWRGVDVRVATDNKFF